jgi:Ca2+-binding RTX toxin-like protein
MPIATLTQFTVNNLTEFDQTAPQVAALINGHFTFAWTSNHPVFGSSIIYRIFDAQGNPVISDKFVFGFSGIEPALVGIQVPEDIFMGNPSQIQFTIRWGGGAVGTTYNGIGVGGDTIFYEQVGAVVASAGVDVSSAMTTYVGPGEENSVYSDIFGSFQISAGINGGKSDPTGTITQAGYVFAWNNQLGDVATVYARVLDFNGGVQTTVIDTGTVGTVDDPIVRGIGYDKFSVDRYVVAWVDTGSIRARIIGSAVDLEFAVNQSPSTNSNQPDMIFLEDGRFIIAWAETQSSVLTLIKARIFTFEGQAAGDEFVISETQQPVTNIDMSREPNGILAVTWDSFDETTGRNITAAYLDPYKFNGTSGNDTWIGGNKPSFYEDYNSVGEDTMFGGLGDDTFFGRDDNDKLYGEEDNDRLYGEDGNDALDGGSGSDILSGGLGVDDLDGGDGTDRLDGGDDRDNLRGGAGDDSLFGGSGNDELTGGSGTDLINGGEGSDIVNYADSSGIELSLDGSFVAVGEASRDTLVSIENIRGSAVGNDRLAGNAEDNKLFGAGGNDILIGRAGNDVLDGGSGRDVLNGGDGHDAVSFLSSTEGMRIFLANGTRTGNALGDQWISIEGIWGSNFDDTLIGNSSNNDFRGYGGNDSLIGAGGDDVLNGGGGQDFIDGGAGSDTLSFEHDFESGVVASLASPDEGSVYVSIENIAGTRLGNDQLTGDSKNNTLYGLGGNDILVGGGGNDTYDGGDGYDIVSYAYSNAGVRFNLANTSLSAGDARGDRYISIESCIGSSFDDQLFGDASSNLLFGSEGDDLLYGAGGADALDGGSGTDTVDYSHVRSAIVMTADMFLMQVVSGGEAAGDRLTGIEIIKGSNIASDTLVGDGNSNTLYGNGGNDKLYGDLGGDILIGGAGADFMDGGEDSDLVDYSSASSVTISLDGSVAGTGEARGDVFVSIESVRGSLKGDDRLIGNVENNSLDGQGGSDILNGRDGNDFLSGGSGRDTLIGGAGSDTFAFSTPADAGDTMVDFEFGDLIYLSPFDFGFFSVSDAIFEVSTSNVASDDATRLIFDSDDYRLWFDADGSGSTKAVLLATFANGYQLSANDFSVF